MALLSKIHKASRGPVLGAVLSFAVPINLSVLVLGPLAGSRGGTLLVGSEAPLDALADGSLPGLFVRQFLQPAAHHDGGTYSGQPCARTEDGVDAGDDTTSTEQQVGGSCS